MCIQCMPVSVAALRKALVPDVNAFSHSMLRVVAQRHRLWNPGSVGLTTYARIYHNNTDQLHRCGSTRDGSTGISVERSRADAKSTSTACGNESAERYHGRNTLPCTTFPPVRERCRSHNARVRPVPNVNSCCFYIEMLPIVKSILGLPVASAHTWCTPHGSSIKRNGRRGWCRTFPLRTAAPPC